MFFDSNEKINKKFDIIFIDPPYKEIRVNNLLEKILEKKLLKNNGIFIIHRHQKDKLELTKKIKMIDIRIYRNSKIYIAN